MSSDHTSELNNEEQEKEITNELNFEKGNLVYESRMRELIKNVAMVEEFENIRIGKNGATALQNALRFVMVMFTYELLEILKNNDKKTVTVNSVNDALSNLLGKADSFTITINELESLIKKLQNQSNESSISKAMDFVNLLDSDNSELIEDEEDEDALIEEEIKEK